jgi:hypothetical protein
MKRIDMRCISPGANRENTHWACARRGFTSNALFRSMARSVSRASRSRSYAVLTGDVDLEGGVRVAQFGGPVSRAVGVAIGHRHAASVGRQRTRRRPADPGCAADYDGDPLATVAHPVDLSTA